MRVSDSSCASKSSGWVFTLLARGCRLKVRLLGRLACSGASDLATDLTLSSGRPKCLRIRWPISKRLRASLPAQ